MNKRILISGLILAALQMVVTLPMAMAGDDGHGWLKFAPAFCRSEPYSNLSPKQMSKCDEAAFRYLSKNWKTIIAANGQPYEIAIDTITRNLPDNVDSGATLRAATVVVYIPEGDIFNPNNVLHFYFDCLDRFQILSSFWSPTAYAPPLSIAAKISSIACKQVMTRNNLAKPHPLSITNDKSYDPIPPGWNRKIGLPGTLDVGVEYCTQSGQCKTVKAKMPVEVLASAPTGTVIVRIEGKNYGLGNFGNGVEVSYQGVSMSLMEYLQHNGF